jgi:hypothetical protein
MAVHSRLLTSHDLRGLDDRTKVALFTQLMFFRRTLN